MIRNAAAIVGIGSTEYSSNSARSELQMALEACDTACTDANIVPSQIDGIVRYGAAQMNLSAAWLATNLGIDELRYWASIDFGGGASAATIAHAAMAVATGQANHVLCIRSTNGRSGLRAGTSDTYERYYRGVDPSYDNFLVPYGFTAPVQTYAMLAHRHMHEYGTRPEQLGAIAVTCRDNAAATPHAQMFGRRLTLDEYLQAPVISDPLRKFDCCLQTDGAAAVIVTTLERAVDLGATPVVVAGAVQSTIDQMQGPMHSAIVRQNLLVTTAHRAAQQLYRQTGLGPHDIDVAQIYDCFTITALLQLEDYGFCAKGEGGPFAAEGNIGMAGALPINTDGGNLSGGYIQGLNHVLEGVRQMRGTSARQVAGAETCLVTAGIPGPTSALILTRGLA